MSQNLCILGSTGSVGQSTLDVIRRNPDDFRVKVLTANTQVEKMLAHCLEFEPEMVVMRDSAAAAQLESELRKRQSQIRVKAGEKALVEAANYPGLSTVVAAIVGAAGLLPTLTAVENGLKVLLANKEALVMSGEIFTQAVKNSGAILLPVDSEHNAIFQCLPESTANTPPDLSGVSKILLTGSGGPFRTLPLEELAGVSPEQACAHPNWDMGRKISVDSATMMNKGLELIEACFLFAVSPEKIQIVVHPQSIVHSMVAFMDGSVIAQMGNPDMRTPIAHSLAWPRRIDAGVEMLDFVNLPGLTFEAPDFNRFPCLRLAQQALASGGSAACILNAANEVAVDAFLNQKIRFTDIANVIEKVLEKQTVKPVKSIEGVLFADKQARLEAQEQVDLRKRATHGATNQ